MEEGPAHEGQRYLSRRRRQRLRLSVPEESRRNRRSTPAQGKEIRGYVTATGYCTVVVLVVVVVVVVVAAALRC